MQSLPPALPRRSLFVTILGWTIIVISGLLILISFISFLMILVGSYGTSGATLLGFFNVVIAPPLAFACGIGLLLRKRWGLYGVIAVLVYLSIIKRT